MKKYLYASYRLIKLILAYFLLNTVYRRIYKKNIWLIQEKHTEARDNGFHLYVYIKEKHPEVNAYYSIAKGSPDENKIRRFGSVIETNSIKHYIYWLAAKYSISSQQKGAAPYPVDFFYRFRTMCRKDQRTIFLQHGIIKDDMEELHYDNLKFDLFVCSTPLEYKQVILGFGYPQDKVKLIGMCRYDALFDNRRNTEKQILIMPTFRQWLRPAKTYEFATEKEEISFKQSTFYKAYKELLCNERLIQKANEYGYRIVFYLHYAFQPYTRCFKELENSTVTIADRYHYDVQSLLINSSVLITDYSSVFYDFAYMRKPVEYFQFDESFYRKNHYCKGYFDYRKDGFGPVYTNSAEIVEYTVFLIENNSNMENQYIEKVNSCFAFYDNRNCLRNFNAINSII